MGYKKKKKSNPNKMQKFKNLKKKRKDAFKQQSKKILKKPPNAPEHSGKKDPKHSFANDRSLTCYDGVWVKNDAVTSLQSLKAELTRKNLSNKKVKLIMLKAKRKANRKLQIESKPKTTQDKTTGKKKIKTNKMKVDNMEENKDLTEENKDLTEENNDDKTEDMEGDVVME